MSEAKKITNHDQEFISLDEFAQTIFVANLELNNPELFAELQKLDSDYKRINELKKVIDLGTFVKSKVQMMMDTDYVNLQVKNMMDHFNNGLESTQNEILTLVQNNFDPSKANSYTNQVNDFFNRFKSELNNTIQNTTKELNESKDSIKKNIDESFNPDLSTSYLAKVSQIINDFQSKLDKSFDFSQEGSISNQLKQLLDENFGDNGKVIKAVERKLSFDNPESTIKVLQDNLTSQLDGIKKEIELIKNADELQKEANKKSVQKGYDFEDQLLKYLDDYAAKLGDVVEDLTKVPGATTSSKKGDFNYQVKSLNKTIAIEARNRSTVSTPATLIKDLDKTKTNRNADYTIYIVADEEQLHTQVGIFQEYDGDKIVTHFGLWQVALKVAISRLMLENSSLGEIDKASVEKEISNIEATLKKFTALKTSATNVKNEAEKINSKADEIKNGINNSLLNLNELLFSQGQIIL